MQFEFIGNQDKETLIIRLTRNQMETLQKGVNKLLSATMDTEKNNILITFADSKDDILLERV